MRKPRNFWEKNKDETFLYKILKCKHKIIKMESYGGYRQINGTKKQNQIHKNIWYMIIE